MVETTILIIDPFLLSNCTLTLMHDMTRNSGKHGVRRRWAFFPLTTHRKQHGHICKQQHLAALPRDGVFLKVLGISVCAGDLARSLRLRDRGAVAITVLSGITGNECQSKIVHK